MKLDPKALAITSAIMLGGATLVVGLLNLGNAEYGTVFLQMLASVYHGYHAEATFVSVLIGTGYAIVDGAICGYVFAWIYNRLSQ